jgi:pimeloyl-ACP methyl ester carboxylesterase
MSHTHTQVGAHTIAATSAGPAGRRPFVLIHGIGVSQRYFGPLLAELSRQFRVVSLDLPGFGSSSRPPQALTIPELADVVAQFIAQEQLSSPILVGQSMGCQVVSQLAAAHPNITGHIVLISPTVYDHERTIFKQSWRLFQDTFFEPPLVNAIVLGDYLRCGPRRYLATVPHMLTHHLEDQLPRLRAQYLVIRGSRDRIVPHDWAAKLAGASPRASFAQIAGAPHLVQFTHAAQVARLCAKMARS